MPTPASNKMGRYLLLDTETPFDAVAAMSPSPDSPVRTPALQKIGAFTLVRKAPLDESKHFAVIAGWGHAGKGGVTMPGAGKTVERDYAAEDRRALGDAVRLLGDRTLDVYLMTGHTGRTFR
jgi:hypothetical protein